MSRTRIIFLLLVLGCMGVSLASAETADELRAKIENQTKQIQELDQEISKYEKELSTVGKEKQTLQTAVKELDVSRSKISTQISATEKRINVLGLEIDELGGTIAEHQGAIERNSAALGELLRRIDEVENTSAVEAVLTSGSMSQFWDDMIQTERLQETIGGQIQKISDNKTRLEQDKIATEEKRDQLFGQQTTLSSQKRSLDINRSEKNQLLAQTKSKESTYQSILEDKRKARIEFEKSLSDYESKLKFTLDPSRLPAAGKGVLHWPLDSVTVTQRFGNTDFAKSGAYNGSGHNGIDLRASVGTPIKAALSGTIEATGNTDAYSGCYSYGKWILVRHGNNLSTLYAHLSQVSVSSGQSVETGEVIGYSGNTGYSTGPHLHFGVYVSSEVKVVRMGDVKAKTNCAGAYVPIAPVQAYLNPLSYLSE